MTLRSTARVGFLPLWPSLLVTSLLVVVVIWGTTLDHVLGRLEHDPP